MFKLVSSFGRFSAKVGSIFDEATAALRRCRRDVCHRNEFVATSRCSRLLTLIELILGTTLANPKLSPLQRDHFRGGHGIIDTERQTREATLGE